MYLISTLYVSTHLFYERSCLFLNMAKRRLFCFPGEDFLDMKMFQSFLIKLDKKNFWYENLAISFSSLRSLLLLKFVNLQSVQKPKKV
jgi:hypothetical protein